MYSLSPIQEKSLRLLIAFDSCCRQLNLRYWLAGGTLLGALRHGGFIPWDDEIDVVLLRPDYNRLAEYLEAHPISGTYWESAESAEHATTIHLHGKICVEDSGFFSKENSRHKFGLDVFALDGVWEDKGRRYRQYFLSSFYKHLLPLLFGGSSERFSTVKSFLRRILRPFFPDMERVVMGYRRVIKGPSHSMLLYSGSGRYGWKKETFFFRWFEKTSEIPFEGFHCPIPSGAKDFLFHVYGADCLSVSNAVRTAPHYRVDLTRDRTSRILVSFVLATCGRTKEVSEWIASAVEAARVAGVDVQLIVADQNDDNRLVPVLERVPAEWELVHEKIRAKGVCLARNSVLNRVKGLIVAFPDDDCLYEPGVLREVVRHFSCNKMADVVVGVTVKRDGMRLSKNVRKKIGRYSLFWHGEMYLQFYRREILNCIGDFDEAFGPGNESKFPYGGDDSDYLARAVLAGLSVWRDTSVQIWHPPQDTFSFDRKKIEGYGRTRMALLAKHRYSFLFRFLNLIFPVFMLALRPSKARYYRAMFKGRRNFP